MKDLYHHHYLLPIKVFFGSSLSYVPATYCGNIQKYSCNLILIQWTNNFNEKDASDVLGDHIIADNFLFPVF